MKPNYSEKAAQWSSLMGYITSIYALLGYKVALIKLDIYGGSLKKGKLFLNNVSQNKKPKNKQNSGSKTHAAIIAGIEPTTLRLKDFVIDDDVAGP